MNICMVTPEFVTSSGFSGGIAQHFYRIAKWAVAEGHRVDVVAYGEKDENLDFEGIYVHHVALHMPLISRIVNRLTLRSLKTILMQLSHSHCLYKKAKQLHRQHHLDVVQSVSFKFCGLMTLLFLRVPHVVTGTSYRPDHHKLLGIKTTWGAKAEEFMEWIYYRLSTHTYVPSFELKRILAEKANIRNVRVIRTPFYQEVQRLDNSVYRERLKGKTYLLFFGRLNEIKGVHILGQALPEIFSKIPEAYAVFVGDDVVSSFGSSMRQYITDVCGDDKNRLIFMEKCRHGQLYPIIEGAHLVVLPSLTDNLPNALLEAMGQGQVVIGTRGASFDEVIEDGQNGFLVNPGNPQELAHKIIEVWNRKDLEEIGRNALRGMKKFLPEKVIADLFDYYQEIIDRDRNKIKKRRTAYNR